jgi:hypothetical protein
MVPQSGTYVWLDDQSGSFSLNVDVTNVVRGLITTAFRFDLVLGSADASGHIQFTTYGAGFVPYRNYDGQLAVVSTEIGTVYQLHGTFTPASIPAAPAGWWLADLTVI